MNIVKIISTNLLHAVLFVVSIYIYFGVIKLTGIMDDLSWYQIFLKSTWTNPMYYHIYEIPFFIYVLLFYSVFEIFIYYYSKINFKYVLMLETLPVVLILLRWAFKYNDWQWYAIITALLVAQFLKYYLMSRRFNARV